MPPPLPSLASSSLSTPSSHAISAPLPSPSALRLTPASLLGAKYDLPLTLSFLARLQPPARNVALQFPDELLGDSVEVFRAVQRGLDELGEGGRAWVLGDTTYGSCCIDSLSAQHIAADVLIHYGHACLTPSADPALGAGKRVRYVFPKMPIGVDECAGAIERLVAQECSPPASASAAAEDDDAVQQKAAGVLVIYDVGYAHAIDKLELAVRRRRLGNDDAKGKRREVVFSRIRVEGQDDDEEEVLPAAAVETLELSDDPSRPAGQAPAPHSNDEGESTCCVPAAAGGSSSNSCLSGGPTAQKLVRGCCQPLSASSSDSSVPAGGRCCSTSSSSAAAAPGTCDDVDGDGGEGARGGSCCPAGRQPAAAGSACCSTSATSGATIVDGALRSSCCSARPSPPAAAASTSRSSLRSYSLPPNTKLEEFVLFFIGREESLHLRNLLVTHSKNVVYSYSPPEDADSESSSAEPPSPVLQSTRTNRLLMRRYAVMQKARDADVFGLLVGNVNLAGSLPLLTHLRALLKQKHKKTYTVAVGKLNPAKLANFAEVECFVLVACGENTLVDSKDFYRPIITPYELELALQDEPQWGAGEYVLDFTKLLPKGLGPTDEQPSPSELAPEQAPSGSENDDDDQPIFSTTTGTYRHPKRYGATTTTTAAAAAGPTDSTSLTLRSSDSALTHTNLPQPSALWKGRTWVGLDPRVGLDKVGVLEEGRGGRAWNYEEEKEREG